MLMDTAKPSYSAPLYVTYLSDVDNQISAIRVNSEGNAYVVGTTTSPEFPHESSLSIAGTLPQFRDARLGFVSVLNPMGSGLLWSTLLQNARLTALALDDMGNVYITGRVASGQPSSASPRSVRTAKPSCGARSKLTAGCDDVLVAELSDRGRELSYVARFGGSADEEGRAISTTAQDPWIFVAGDTVSPDFPTSSAANTSRHDGLQSFVVALQPCRTGVMYSRLLAEDDNLPGPKLALTAALDIFTATSSGAFPTADLGKTGQKPVASVQIAPTCPLTAP
jgi:hypothetical protein